MAKKQKSKMGKKCKLLCVLLTCFMATLLCLSGILSIPAQADNLYEIGDSITLSADGFFSLKGAKASLGRKTYASGYEIEGVQVDSSSPYSGSINKTFTTSSAFECRFPGEKLSADAVYRFTVKSVATNDSFDICYGYPASTSWGQAWVEYTDANNKPQRRVVTTHSFPIKTVNSTNVGSNGCMPVTPMGDDTAKQTTNNMFAVQLNGDVVEVYIRYGNKIAKYYDLTASGTNSATKQAEYYTSLVCAFDGTDTETADAKRWNNDTLTEDNDKYYLPKLDFSEGYTISFGTEYINGIDVAFLTYAEGVGTDKASYESMRQNFKDMEMQGKISSLSVYNGDTELSGGEIINMPIGATSWDLKLKVGYIKDGINGFADGGFFDIPISMESLDTSTVFDGEFDAGGYLSDNPLKIKVVEKVPSEFLFGELTSIDGTAKLTSDYIKYKESVTDRKEVQYKGAAIESSSAYSGSFAGTFYGDLELGFRFMGKPETDVANAYCDRIGDFSFVIEDAVDPSVCFTIAYRQVGTGVATIGVAMGRDLGLSDMYTWHITNKTFSKTPGGNLNPKNGSFYPGFNSDPNETEIVNTLRIKNIDSAEDMLVQSSMGYNNSLTGNGICNVAKFDGSNAAMSAESCGLKQIHFKNGYKIYFSSNYLKGTDICFISMNGCALSDGLNAESISATLNSEYSINGTNNVEIPLNAKSLGFSLTEKVRVLGLQEIFVTRQVSFSEDIQTTTPFEAKPITVSYGNRVVEVYNVGVTYPEMRVQWASNISIVEDVNVGAGNTVVLPSISDILLIEEETLSGGYQKVTGALSIKIIEPNGTEEKEVADVQFVNPGEYTVVYYAPSSIHSNYVDRITRIINVIDEEIPVFTLDGVKIVSGYVGQTINIPSATAKAGNTECEVVVTIMFGIDVIATGTDITSFVASREGKYWVNYAAVSSESKSNSNSFTVEIIKDSIGPSITVDFADMIVKPGTIIELPNDVTAVDNIDGIVEVLLSVKYGTEDVALTENRFVAQEQGFYSVIWSAIDQSGNRSEKVFNITVNEAGAENDENHTDIPNVDNRPNNPNSSFDFSGCNSIMGYFGAGIASMTILFVVTGYMLKKKKK